MSDTVITTREFCVTVAAQRYANSKQIERTIHGNMILTGTTSPSDLLHALQATIAEMKNFHFIGQIEILISDPATPRS